MINQEEKEAVKNILKSRENSNKAISEQDLAGVSSYWMDDIIVISGEGGQYIGKPALIAVFKEMFAEKNPPVFIRIPNELKIADSADLAWETGDWICKNEKARGNYSAMWMQVDNIWLIRSELFVSLD